MSTLIESNLKWKRGATTIWIYESNLDGHTSEQVQILTPNCLLVYEFPKGTYIKAKKILKNCKGDEDFEDILPGRVTESIHFDQIEAVERQVDRGKAEPPESWPTWIYLDGDKKSLLCPVPLWDYLYERYASDAEIEERALTWEETYKWPRILCGVGGVLGAILGLIIALTSKKKIEADKFIGYIVTIPICCLIGYIYIIKRQKRQIVERFEMDAQPKKRKKRRVSDDD